MRILFATSHAYPPQRYGGCEMSVHALARLSIAHGHQAAVFAQLDPTTPLGLAHRPHRRLTRSPRPAADGLNGYPVYRSWAPESDLLAMLDHWRPDAVVVEGNYAPRRAVAYAEAGQRTLVYLRDCEWHFMGVDEPPRSPRIRYLANSGHTAAAYAQRFGIDATVIPPFVDPALYRTPVHPRFVTFINPIPEKGVDIALALAEANPDVRFRFVRAWPRPPEEVRALARRLATLPNVELLPPEGDMRRIYREAALMLVPSQWIEAWGRVVSEAQVSGIPALASTRGGLPEAVGEGGLLLPHDAPLDGWNSALRTILVERDRFSRLALAEAARPERQPRAVAQRFVDALTHPTPVTPAEAEPPEVPPAPAGGKAAEVGVHAPPRSPNASNGSAAAHGSIYRARPRSAPKPATRLTARATQ